MVFKNVIKKTQLFLNIGTLKLCCQQPGLICRRRNSLRITLCRVSWNSSVYLKRNLPSLLHWTGTFSISNRQWPSAFKRIVLSLVFYKMIHQLKWEEARKDKDIWSSKLFRSQNKVTIVSCFAMLLFQK